MALQFILGNSGAGKSHYIFEKIIQESAKNPNKQYLVIVPEQFTMQTQKDLVMMHPRRGIMNIDVLSFERLAHRVFHEVGKENRKILEDTGKNLILRKIAEEKKDELVLLGGNLRKLGYISEMKSLISEFTQYRLEPEGLLRVIEQNKNNPQLYFKLKDMLIIYQSFREYLKDTYLTAEELLEALSDVVEQSVAVKDSVIVLDGYTGFTPVQMNLMEKLLVLADKVFITMTIDSRENPFQIDAEYQLFHMTKKSVADLVNLAKRVHVEIEKPLLLGNAKGCRYHNAPALAFLESHIFRHKKEFWGDKTEEIHFYAARTPRAEAEWIGREIQKRVRDDGVCYRDIAVVTGDLEVYGPLLHQVFARFGIPGFIDQKRDVLQNPFVEFLRALTAAVLADFSYESMFRLLRTGMTKVDATKTDRLENYVIARGIRNFSGWNREWKYPLRGMEEEELEELNLLREEALTGLEALRKGLKNRQAGVEDMTHAIYDYLVLMGVQQQLEEYEKNFEQEGDYSLAKEYAQIYGMIMELFDKLVMLLSDCHVTLEEYIELLDAGLSELKVGLIPASTDQVLVGDMERSRLKDIRILFFAGINEGSVPRNKSRAGILSEMDREVLKEQKIELAPTSRQETYIQKFYIYLNLTKPSERLYLSWSLSDTAGNALRPSYLVAQVQQLFPKVPIHIEEDFHFLDRLATPSSSVPELLEALRAVRFGEASVEQETLIQWYSEQEKWQRRLTDFMNAVCFEREESAIGRAVARALYGTLMEGSVTRLEQFAACAYAHFLQYGLQLKEREIYGLQAVDMGNVFHSALKYFSDSVEAGGYGWFHVPDEKRVEWMEEALNRAVEEYENKIFSESAREHYVLERVRRIGQRTAWAILHQLEKGAFFPEQTEVSFQNLEHLKSVSVLLSEDERMRLKGRIDRIDICRKDGKVYVRVVDYKSGKTQFDLTSVYYGLQLQLVVYLNAAMELQKRKQAGEVHPAGMFYYHIEDPILDYGAEMDPQKRMLKELAWNGLVNGNREIVDLMDHEIEMGSDLLPLHLKKDGGYTATSSVAEEEEFMQLLHHVSRKLSEYGERILKGDIRMQPYELGDENACSYCTYHSVCGFDQNIKGCEKRRLQFMEKSEVWNRLKEEES